MSYLLDTNTCIKYLNGRSDSVRKNIESKRPQDIMVCSVVKATEEHIKSIIFSLLSNQRPWEPIAENEEHIDEIFFQYDLERIRQTSPEYFVRQIRDIKCGNRVISQQITDEGVIL